MAEMTMEGIEDKTSNVNEHQHKCYMNNEQM